MSYITLFLTLEYAVVPRMKVEHPDWSHQEIMGDKYRYFHQLLASRALPGPKPKDTMYKFRDHIGYGSRFWTFGQDIGIASLLMLGVSEHGLSTIARKTRPRSEQIPAMAAALSSSQTWWAFAHATGPRVLRTLFGLGNVRYTIPQLLTFVRAEPMPASTMSAIHQKCININLETDLQLHAQEPGLSSVVSSFVGDRPIPVKYHPNGNLGNGQVEKRNLAKWLVNTSDTAVVRDTSKTEFPFTVFKTLLPPSEISTELVQFFVRLYNRKAIPGRMAAFQSSLGTPEGNQSTFDEFLDTLSSTSSSLRCEILLCPYDLTRATVAFVIRRDSPSVEVFNWMQEDRGLTQEIGTAFGVCSVLQVALQ